MSYVVKGRLRSYEVETSTGPATLFGAEVIIGTFRSIRAAEGWARSAGIDCIAYDWSVEPVVRPDDARELAEAQGRGAGDR